MNLPRLYPILDTGSLSRLGCAPSVAAEAMLAGGARMLQFRHKSQFSRLVFDEASRIAGLCRDAGAIFIIDDRADIALLLDAGLHVGQDDLPPVAARRIIGAGLPLGFSTHNEAQLRAAASEPADYLAIGPVFGTATKENADPVVGLEELRRLKSIDGRPLVAIGGITRQNVQAVLDAGADCAAVIGDLLPEDCTFESIRARMEQWQRLLK
jgi:thiamine-phosphate pyrophosphorylase